MGALQVPFIKYRLGPSVSASRIEGISILLLYVVILMVLRIIYLHTKAYVLRNRNINQSGKKILPVIAVSLAAVVLMTGALMWKGVPGMPSFVKSKVTTDDYKPSTDLVLVDTTTSDTSDTSDGEDETSSAVTDTVARLDFSTLEKTIESAKKEYEDNSLKRRADSLLKLDSAKYCSRTDVLAAYQNMNKWLAENPLKDACDYKGVVLIPTVVSTREKRQTRSSSTRTYALKKAESKFVTVAGSKGTKDNLSSKNPTPN